MKHPNRMLCLICALIMIITAGSSALADENRSDYKPMRMEYLKYFAKGTYDLGHSFMTRDTRSNRYSSAITGYMSTKDGSAYEIYDIGGKYHYFSATVAVVRNKNGINEKYSGSIKIYGDDRLLWSEDKLNSMTVPAEIMVDVSSVLELKIEMHGEGNEGEHGVKVMLGNPMLLEDDPGFYIGAPEAPSQKAYENAVDLNTIRAYANGKYSLGEKKSAIDVRGNKYGFTLTGFMSPSDGTAYQIYDIGGKYQFLTATVAPLENNWGIGENYAGIIRIYGDDRLLWSDEEITSRTRPYNIVVYLGNTMDLKIEMYGWANDGSNGIKTMLANPQLLPPD